MLIDKVYFYLKKWLKNFEIVDMVKRYVKISLGRNDFENSKDTKREMDLRCMA